VNAPSRRAPQAPLPGKQAKATPARKTLPTCPICGKSSLREYRPFCSKRCADIDLGHWLGGRYAVPGEPLHRDND
jgi:endogenous inhibitor of DNA gyrase (YacG/DUF329 family)